MQRYTCKVCGEQLEDLVDGFYVCKYCGSRWKVEAEANTPQAVKSEGAWEALRSGDFERAEERFDEAIAADKNDHEAYWGRALAGASIVYVNDLNENKKVPTCNNISEQSFADGSFVQKAIQLAPADIAAFYKQQAAYIDKVRTEWLQKASKEPAYDVFISYKDSDREHGIERTQDSVDAQELYTELIQRGYKVFYSRISLRDKVAEQYEPYIYNAIKTAKVMIVFAEKTEYVTATWVKNEWSRFKTRIEKKEKHPNSLVVVYKGLNPGELPLVLKSRQCLNMGDISFLTTLLKHVEKVVGASKQVQGVEKIEIQGGKIAKKQTEISQNQIKTRDVGGGTLVETSLDDKQTFSLVQTYLSTGDYAHAKSLLDDLLFNNPNDGEFLLASFLIEKRCADFAELLKKLDTFTDADFATLENVLNCSKKSNAEKLLDKLYASANDADDAHAEKILKLVLPFNCKKRQKYIDDAFDKCTASDKYNSFKLLLSTLDNKDVDKYIQYNLDFAYIKASTKCSPERMEHKIECADAVLAVDEGNVSAYRYKVCGLIKQDKPVKDVVDVFEKLLSYSDDTTHDFLELLGELTQPSDYFKELKMLERQDELVAHSLYVLNTGSMLYANLGSYTHTVELVKQLIRYYPGEMSDTRIIAPLVRFADVHRLKKNFADADYFYKLALTYCKNEPRIYLGISLVQVKATDLDHLGEAAPKLLSVPEFDKFLALIDADNRRKIIDSVKKQAAEYEKEHQAAIEREAAEKQRLLAEKRQKEAAAAAAAKQAALEREMAAEEARKLRRTKRIMLIVVLAIVAFLVYATVKSELMNHDVVNGVGYTENTVGGMTVLGYDEDTWFIKKANVVLPSEYDGKPVTTINRSAFADSERLTSIVISDSVTKIGDRAFANCTNLQSVTLGSGVVEIGGSAFEGCTSLKEIVLPASVTEIGTSAFDGCTSLTSITVNSNVTLGSQVFYGCDNLHTLVIGSGDVDVSNFLKKHSGFTDVIYKESVTSIGKGALADADNITSVVIQEGITRIGENAFCCCTGLVSIDIPSSVTLIGAHAFDGCGVLSSVNFAQNSQLTTIGDSAFSCCANLSSIEIPQGVTSIGEYAFQNCTNLANVEFEENSELTTIHENAFLDCTSLTSIVIPQNVLVIDNSAFRNCTSLTNVGFAENEQHAMICDRVFEGCVNLSSIEIPQNITAIGESAFSGCTNLVNVEFVANSQLTTIGEKAFYGCANLTSIEIPTSVTTIGGAFLGSCTNLTEVVFDGTIEQWNAITKDPQWDSKSGYSTVQCSDGVVQL